MSSPDAFTAPFMLTKAMHRDVYPAVDPTTNPELNAASKVVVVFGATSGVGYAIADSWISAGVDKIVLVGRNAETLVKAATDLKSSSKTFTITADVAYTKATDDVFKKTLEKFGRIDVVVTAFGIMDIGPVGVQNPGLWWQQFEVNVKGVYNVSHSFINATDGKGTLINIVSLGASFTNPGMSAYSTSKLAAIKFLEYLDVEQPALRVFSIHPGMVVAENGRGAELEVFAPFTHDRAALTGGLTVYLDTPRADFLKGSYLHANWDVSELEQHKEEIVEKRLTKLAFLNGQLQPGGYPWSS